MEYNYVVFSDHPIYPIIPYNGLNYARLDARDYNGVIYDKYGSKVF